MIVQIAPFVLYDLLPENLLNVWVALSTLVPLIWLPVISNIEDHVVCFFFLIILAGVLISSF